MSPLSNLTAYVSIPEGSAATPGLFDSRFNALHGNVTQVNNDLSSVSLIVSSVSGSGITGYRDVTLVRYGGALGDGTTNDQPAFVSGNSSTATQAVLYVPSSASVYKIAAPLTLAGTLAPIRGAILRPSNSSATVTITGAVLAGPYKIFDASAGLFDFTGNKEIPYYLPQWFGVTGDGTTNDQPALTSMVSSLPNGARVLWTPGMTMRLDATWKIAGRQSMVFEGTINPNPDGRNAPTFIWGGASAFSASDGSISAGSTHFFSASGPFTAAMVDRSITVPSAGSSAAGSIGSYLRTQIASFVSAGRVVLATAASQRVTGANYTVDSPPMIWFYSTDHCELGSVKLRLDSLWDGSSGSFANRGINISDSGLNFTGTSNVLRDINIQCQQVLPLPDFPHYRGIFIQETGSANQEFNELHRVFIFGPGASPTQASGTIAGASLGTLSVTPNQQAWPVGTRVRIASAATGAQELDTTLTGGASGTWRLASDASQAVTSVQVIFGTSRGVAVEQGPSSDIHRTKIVELHSTGNGWGYLQQNGSARIIDFNAGGNEIDIEIDAAALPMVIEGSNMEQSRAHLIYRGGASLELTRTRLSNLFIRPNHNLVELISGAPVFHHDNHYDDAPPDGSLTIGSTQYTGKFFNINNTWGSSTASQTGINAMTNPLFDGDGLIDASTFGSNNVRSHLRYNTTLSGLSEGVLGEIVVDGSSVSRVAGVRGRALVGSTDANKEFTGVIGSAHQKSSGLIQNQTLRSFLAEQPIITPGIGGQKATAMEGMRVTAPSITGPGGTSLAVGIVVESQATSGVDASQGIVQLGATDPNTLAGPTYFGSGSSVLPPISFSSESSLGVYRSGAATLAPSYGTFNLATNAVRLSVRTLSSGDSTNIAVNEALFIVAGASGASIGIRSGGTIYYFASSLSTKG